jgi:Concanavalin A-like lectin/glucanases superfamily
MRCLLLWLFPLLAVSRAMAGPSGYSLRFHGTGSGDVDRVKIPLDNPSRMIDVSGDFTIEFWMRALPGENSGTLNQYGGGDGWITGNVMIDRDVFNAGDHGDYGISLGGDGNLAFGIDRSGNGMTITTSGVNLADGNWHHVAATRNGITGQMRVFVDGIQRASGTGPIGNISYRDGRSTSYPNSDPFLVLGAEKHDYAPEFPSFAGWLDELRVSTVVRYSGHFTPPSVPFAPDAQTAALYHFDEGHGLTVHDTGNATGGPTHGIRRVGGNLPDGPQWSALTPYAQAADADNDGMWDWYETAWFGGPTPGLPTLDTDGDGHSNLREFRAATSPLNPLDRLHIHLTSHTEAGISLTAATVPGKVYHIEFSPNLRAPWSTLGPPMTATSQETQWPDLTPAAPGLRGFFRAATSP